MREKFTIYEAYEMTRGDLNDRLNSCCNELEALGMEHVDATRFVSEVMNMGIALNWKNEDFERRGLTD